MSEAVWGQLERGGAFCMLVPMITPNDISINCTIPILIQGAHDMLHTTAGEVTAQRSATMAASHSRQPRRVCQAFTPRTDGHNSLISGLIQSVLTDGVNSACCRTSQPSADLHHRGVNNQECPSLNLLEVISDFAWLCRTPCHYSTQRFSRMSTSLVRGWKRTMVSVWTVLAVVHKMKVTGTTVVS